MAETKGEVGVEDEDEIDSMKMVKVIRLCKQNGIDLSGKPTLDEMKLLLKLVLHGRPRGREEEMAKLQRDFRLDEARRDDMRELYERIAETTRNVMKLDDPVVRELRQMFPEISKRLRKEICSLEKSHAPILVLGETGAGKSSFINLLLGLDILPSSMLSNTHVVCEIKHNKTFSAILYPLDDDVSPKYIHSDQGVDVFRVNLAAEIQRLNNGHGVYKKAEIYLPCAILESGVVLVDSPGIGETREMKDIVLDYIINACTFIYLISSDSAGGMQQRMQNLLHEVYQKAFNEQKMYEPERAIFVCNKWDQVPPNERKEVKEDTIKKIMEFWPACKRSQIFTFSTKEAAFIQAKGRLSPKFRLVMQEINKLVPLGREIQILKSYKNLDQFVTRCLFCFLSKLEQIKMTAPDRQKNQRETMERLLVLKGNVNSYFDEQTRALKRDIGRLADKLKDFLQEETNMEFICKFSKSDFKPGQDWKTASIAIRSTVYERMTLLIRGWEEQKGEFKKIGDQISRSLEEEFPKFTAEIFKTRDNSSFEQFNVNRTDDEYLVPELVRKQFEGLNFGMKVAVGIGLAPVLFLGMAVRLPVFGFKSLKKSLSDVKMQSNFKKAMGHDSEMSPLEKYARQTVTKITDQLELRSIIEADIQPLFIYLRHQRAQVECLIKQEMDLLHQMQVEGRNDWDIERTYSPLHQKFLMLQLELENFLFTNMPQRYSADFREISEICLNEWKDSTPICRGHAAKVHRAKLTEEMFSGNFRNVCIRVASEEIKPTNIANRKKIQEAYRSICKSFMVRCLGVTVTKRNHYQILEPLQYNLRQFLSEKSNDFETKESWRLYLQDVACQIVHGLNYLHERSFVHFDLSQDTIGIEITRVDCTFIEFDCLHEPFFAHFDLTLDTSAVDENGTIKLTNISVPKRLHIKPDYTDGKVDVSDYIYIPDKFIFCKERSASRTSLTSSTDTRTKDKEIKALQIETYGPKDDMFSVGMLMWEIWTRKPLYTENPLQEVTDDVMNDTDKFRNLLNKFRPVKDPHFVSSPDSEDQIMSEWWTTIHGCINRKLDAKDWLGRWEEVTKTYPNVSLIYSSSHFCMSPKFE